MPNIDEEVSYFSKHFGFGLAYEFGPFAADDNWMAEHQNVNPRAEISKIAIMNAGGINLEIFEYTDNIHRSKTAPNNADIGCHHHTRANY
ncbi:hypothetical protein [Photobacterium rosenbergii]|uniref:Uncharacterized protein n=1 Tax=Photobacterium rosenbergii TaxID=294936 RepID=A0ABU3ZJ48_9GAMM|nr:hypothetical protein [Photobacterium rosenbergii]MDV5170131.1 hypothetical protein [Photobacterium rosenbergii]